MEEKTAKEILEILELQNTVLENQRYIISVLMAKLSMHPDFELSDQLQHLLREVNKSIELLNGGDIF